MIESRYIIKISFCELLCGNFLYHFFYMVSFFLVEWWFNNNVWPVVDDNDKQYTEVKRINLNEETIEARKSLEMNEAKQINFKI